MNQTGCMALVSASFIGVSLSGSDGECLLNEFIVPRGH